MAEGIEENEEKQEVKEEVKGGKSSILKWIIISVAGLVLLGGGLFIGKMIFSTSAPETKKPEKTPKKEQKLTIGPIYTMETFIINLADSSGDKYLKVVIEVELSSEELREEIEKRKSQLRDAVLMLLTSKTYADIDTMTGKDLLRNEIITRLNRFLTMGKIKKVYFVEFVVQ